MGRCFNPTLVRLALNPVDADREIPASFNPTLVRLALLVTISSPDELLPFQSHRRAHHLGANRTKVGLKQAEIAELTDALAQC